LIKADDGYHMWSETYDRSLDNIFAIQDEISAAVVEALKIELLGEAPKAEVVDPEAYALSLKARYLYAKWGKENFENAVTAYQQALAIDPGYAEAWAGLSVTYLSQTQSGYLTSDKGLVLARNAVDKALELNPKLATAWARLALIQGMFEWDWASAEVSVRKALELAPSDPRVLGAAAQQASNLGKLDESLALYLRALEGDPLNVIMLYNIGNTLFRQGHLEEAESAYSRLLELNPADWGTHTQLALIMLMLDRPGDAWAELDLEVDPQQQEIGRIIVLPSLDRDAEALQRLEAFITQNQSWAAYQIAGIYGLRGDVDTAFAWLDQAYQQRNSFMVDILNDPYFESLHDDPRWDEILDKMNLPH
jgi:tetratricopeptide (TPR) repeat protein